MPKSLAGFVALTATQALSAFNHNMLRAAFLTLIAFRPVDMAGASAETLVALSTLFVVAPYAVLSLPAGRVADRFAKSTMIRWVKTSEVAIFGIAAVGLWLMSVPLLLSALLLAGIEAAILGPAKFSILSELLPVSRLLSANAWVTASATVAILLGLITGNLLALNPVGLHVVAVSGIALSLLGWLLAWWLPTTERRAPELSLKSRDLLGDFGTYFARALAVPGLILPMLGCSWFWFQGAVHTSLMPLFVAEGTGLQETAVSLLLIASSLGVSAGAMGALWLARRSVPLVLPLLVFLITALPGIDLWLSAPLSGSADFLRAAADFFVLAAGCGFYIVPLTTAVQQLTPVDERARFVGVNHTLNGLAMTCSGLAILALNSPIVSIPGLFGGVAIVSGILAALAVSATLPALAARAA